jgi:hypothetical protein
MASLDLVVALRIDPGHEPRGQAEDAAFRLAVDGWLREIVDGDGLDLCEGVEILALGGPWDRRAETVLAHVRAMRLERPGDRGR